jgi:hypothetical protein
MNGLGCLFWLFHHLFVFLIEKQTKLCFINSLANWKPNVLKLNLTLTYNPDFLFVQLLIGFCFTNLNKWHNFFTIKRRVRLKQACRVKGVCVVNGVSWVNGVKKVDWFGPKWDVALSSHLDIHAVYTFVHLLSIWMPISTHPPLLPVLLLLPLITTWSFLRHVTCVMSHASHAYPPPYPPPPHALRKDVQVVRT